MNRDELIAFIKAHDYFYKTVDMSLFSTAELRDLKKRITIGNAQEQKETPSQQGKSFPGPQIKLTFPGTMKELPKE